MVLRDIRLVRGVGSSGSREGPMASSCEYCNALPDSIKCLAFLSRTTQLHVVSWFMEPVINNFRSILT
jgi:hypothetical protein